MAPKGSEGVRLSPATVGDLTATQTVTVYVHLTAAATDTRGNTYTNKLITFTSSNENVAAVSADGMVTAAGSPAATFATKHNIPVKTK